jgi:hypothetical protein
VSIDRFIFIDRSVHRPSVFPLIPLQDAYCTGRSSPVLKGAAMQLSSSVRRIYHNYQRYLSIMLQPWMSLRGWLRGGDEVGREKVVFCTRNDREEEEDVEKKRAALAQCTRVTVNLSPAWNHVYEVYMHHIKTTLFQFHLGENLLATSFDLGGKSIQPYRMARSLYSPFLRIHRCFVGI